MSSASKAITIHHRSYGIVKKRHIPDLIIGETEIELVATEVVAFNGPTEFSFRKWMTVPNSANLDLSRELLPR